MDIKQSKMFFSSLNINLKKNKGPWDSEILKIFNKFLLKSNTNNSHHILTSSLVLILKNLNDLYCHSITFTKSPTYPDEREG